MEDQDIKRKIIYMLNASSMLIEFIEELKIDFVNEEERKKYCELRENINYYDIDNICDFLNKE